MKDRNKGKQGYKKTKVGWIPKEWKVEKLDTFVRIISGGTPSRSNLAYWKGTIPWISSSDLYEDDIFKIRIHKYITEKAINDSATKLIPANSILVVSRVGVGKVAISIDAICTSQDFQSLILNTDTIEAQYLAYQVKIHTAELLKLNQGTSINGFLKSDLAKLPIPLPPLPEQKAIASVLECWDRAIHKYEEKIEKKKNIKKGLMQRLLSGKQRLPGFEGGWQEVRLRDVVSISYGKDWKAVAEENGPYPVFGTGGQIGTSSQYLFSSPAILLGRKGTIDSPRLLSEPFWAVDTTFAIHSHSGTNTEFLFNKFQTVPWYQYNEASGVPSLSRRTIENIKITLPSLPEQIAIASVLSSSDSEIKALEKKLAVVKEQKKYLLNNLVTGTIRLPEFCESVVG